MSTEPFDTRVDAVPWENLRGAYGLSTDTEERTDVAEALKTLHHIAPEDRQNDDLAFERWMEAMNVLTSHVYHQADIYPVTSRAMPFVFELIEQHTPSPEEDLAWYPTFVAHTIRRYHRGNDAKKRRLAEECDTAFDAARNTVLQWLDGPLRTPMTMAAIFSPALREDGLARLRTRKSLSHDVLAVLSTLADLPRWVIARSRSTNATAC